MQLLNTHDVLQLGVPVLIRSDCGTENCKLASCHMMLRHHHDDEFRGEKSYRYGSSTTNTVSIILYDSVRCVAKYYYSRLAIQINMTVEN